MPTSVLVPPKVTLASLHGKPAVINFWASWCDPCRKETPELERFSHTLGGRAQVVGVDWNDSSANAADFIRQYGLTYPILRDTDGAVGNRYGLSGLPTTFILNAQGAITDVLPGPQTAATLRHGLQSAG